MWHFFLKNFFFKKKYYIFVFQFNYMEATIKTELIFDIQSVLHVIESNEDLDNIFRNGDKTISYSSYKTLAKHNNLKQETIDKLKQIFEFVILKNKQLEKLYAETQGTPKTKKRKLPKHYGKQQILKDVESNNKMTELDRAMLSLNNLRNIYSKLKNRCIKDKIENTHILTVSDCRDIIAVVRTLENKVENILKK